MYGAIIGDVVGSRFEFNNHRNKNFELFTKKSEFTDDTIMTIAVLDLLLHEKELLSKNIVDKIKYYGRKYPSSYGIKFGYWLNGNSYDSYNSFGNGAAMRVSPIGWMAKNEEQVKEWSKKITEVTHSHPEGIKGAEVTAMCVYYAKNGKSKDFIKNYVGQYYDLEFNYEDLKKNYYFNETCQNTVPQAIYCFLISKNFEDCLRTSISIGGDSDTLAAISCGIAEAYYFNKNDKGLKKIQKKVIKYLPKEFLNILNEYLRSCNKNEQHRINLKKYNKRQEKEKNK